MLAGIARAARRCDEFIAERLGRPYHAVLGASLFAEIVERIRDFHKVTDHANLLRIGVALVVFCLLLLHQVGELDERRQHRRERAH
jgi:hypothetical protein